MIRTYTFKIKPNKSIEQKFNRWLGITRFVYNCSKDLSEQCYKKGSPISGYEISNQLTQAKKDFPWIYEVGANTLQSVIEKYTASMKSFFKGAGYPKWATKKKWKSVYFKSVTSTHNAFKLPKFGIVKVYNFKVPVGIIKTAIITKEAGELYLKVVVKKEKSSNIENQNICGIDMGVSYFLTTSDGEFIENPKHLFKKMSVLRLESRKLSRMKKGGKNYQKQVLAIQKLYQKIGRCRKDFLHKESSKISNIYGTVIREDLNIKEMNKKGNLSKYVLDCGWGLFFSMLEYKTKVIKVSPIYTSQKCNMCGHTCKENRKSQSLFECVSCGHTINADLNAALNILQRGQSLVEAKAVQ